MIRPILDGLIVRMDAPPDRTTSGLLHIPETARADTGTLRAQQAAKVGTVVAVGPGRHYRARELRRGSSNVNDGALYDACAVRAFVPTSVRPGDRVLFDPLAELRPLPGGLWHGAEFQVAAVLS